MGCDIHIVVERREAGSTEWVGTWCSDVLPMRGRPLAARRDYAFFAEIAGVRGRTATTVYDRNLPKDVSRLAWMQFMRAPTDHHSPSHMTVGEFAGGWRRANPSGQEVRDEFAAIDLLGVDPSEERGDDHRVVFWFDN